MRCATRVALTAVLCLGFAIPTLADSPDPPTWEIWLVNYHGGLIDHGFVTFLPPDPETGTRFFSQQWDGDVEQVGEWTVSLDLGPLGVWLRAKPYESVRHYGLEILCLNTHGFFFGKVWDRTCPWKIDIWGGFYLAYGHPAKP